MIAEPEGRLVWKDVDGRDNRKKLHAFYFVDKESRKEAIKLVSARTYDYTEQWAHEIPGNEQALEYRDKEKYQ